MNNIDAGLAVLHVATGVFFTISGYRKTFNPETHAKVTGLFRKLGVGNRFVEWSVPLGEFLGGIGLIVGCLTQFAAAGLLLIICGAYCLDIWPEVKAKHPQGLCDYVSKCLCTPEGQLIVVLVTLILTGAGRYSFDGLMGG